MYGPPPLWPREPGFETLVLLMLEQQVSLAQARAIYARVSSAAGSVTPAALDALHGVGPWTAQCYLLFALRRRDVFPSADLALWHHYLSERGRA
jgi:DNA-3-methyladenine glycosylase II